VNGLEHKIQHSLLGLVELSWSPKLGLNPWYYKAVWPTRVMAGCGWGIWLLASI